jgi:hypothetical protein
MKISDFDETRVSSARARRFFNMLSERKRRAKREREELREEQEILREAEKNRSQAIKASLRDLKKPCVQQQPPSPEPPEKQEPANPVSVDQASLDFWRWCVWKQEEKEEPPPWRVRNTRLYKGTKL